MRVTDTHPLPTFRHVARLTDDRGILEHAQLCEPRFSHGYCTDDNARLLLVSVRDDGSTSEAQVFASIATNFLLDAQHTDGRFRNRLSFERVWLDEACTDDHWGRALWAAGTAYQRSGDGNVQMRGIEIFERSCGLRSPFLRSMSFAALGAAEVLVADPSHSDAQDLLAAAADMVEPSRSTWLWPEPRLTYSNATIPQVLIAAGHLLGDDAALQRGLDLLAWLVKIETYGDHLSPTPAAGRGPNDPKPAFDQQPIEAAAVADAAVTAWTATGDRTWLGVLDSAVGWFNGRNDVGAEMIDHVTGGAYDGLHSHGPNLNEGAESTLAMVATLQLARQTMRG
jgi:hypothetical protein